MKSPKFIKLEVYDPLVDQFFSHLLNLRTEKPIEDLENEFIEEYWDGESTIIDYSPFVPWLEENGYAEKIELEEKTVGQY